MTRDVNELDRVCSWLGNDPIKKWLGLSWSEPNRVKAKIKNRVLVEPTRFFLSSLLLFLKIIFMVCNLTGSQGLWHGPFSLQRGSIMWLVSSGLDYCLKMRPSGRVGSSFLQGKLDWHPYSRLMICMDFLK